MKEQLNSIRSQLSRSVIRSVQSYPRGSTLKFNLFFHKQKHLRLKVTHHQSCKSWRQLEIILAKNVDIIVLIFSSSLIYDHKSKYLNELSLSLPISLLCYFSLSRLSPSISISFMRFFFSISLSFFVMLFLFLSLALSPILSLPLSLFYYLSPSISLYLRATIRRQTLQSLVHFMTCTKHAFSFSLLHFFHQTIFFKS